MECHMAKRVPSMSFGANQTGPENATQLKLDGQYPLVIYGWQTMTNFSNWTHSETSLNQQCIDLKLSGAKSLCVVYRSTATSQPWFDADAAIMFNTSRTTTWFLQDSKTGGPILDGNFHPDPNLPNLQTWFWDYRNKELQAYIADVVVESVMDVDDVDGIFFDMVDYMVCGAYEFSPCDPAQPTRIPCGLDFPDGEQGMRDYYDGVWTAMRGAATKLATKGKLAVFSSTNFFANLSWAPTNPQRMEPGACVKPQDDATRILDGVPSARYYEQWMDGTASHKGATQLVFNRSQCLWYIQNAVREAEAGIASLAHTDVEPGWLTDPNTTPALLNIETALAAFLVTAPVTTPSYYGFSWGQHWLDGFFQFIELYDKEVGTPTSPTQTLGCCDGDLLPHVYVHDAEGHHDLFNVNLTTAEACSSLCCNMSECAGFQWTSKQSGDAGNCTANQSCCWIKPTIGELM